MKSFQLLSTCLVVTFTAAQQANYGQCGGTGWSGPKTCEPGWFCSFQNQWYSQCLQGTGSSMAASTSLAAGTTLVNSTTSSESAAASSTLDCGGRTTLSTSTMSSPASSAPSSGTSAITSFAKTNGNLFTINGKTEYFMGTNTYWIGFLTNNTDIDLVMSHLASTGLKVLRVWGFNDVNSIPSSGTVWFQSFVSGQSPAINTGADGLQRLDCVVQSAEIHGISLIINFVNNWDDYGGIAAYCTYYGISATSWYTSSAAQDQYQKYIAAVVSRYKNSTAVFAWELANEPRCHGCATSAITNWVSSTSAYIKSLDSNHMVTIGDEGFGLNGGSNTSYPFQYGEGTDFATNLAISTIDFGTYHLYPSSWGEVDSWGPSWIQAHANAANSIGKPVIMEEYGSNTHADEASWQASVLGSQTAGDMVWQYGDTISTGQTPNDGYTIYYGTAEYATLVTDHAAAMLAKSV